MVLLCSGARGAVVSMFFVLMLSISLSMSALSWCAVSRMGTAGAMCCVN